MASILSNNQSPEQQQQNPVEIVNNLINQILNSVDPQQTFNQVLSSNKDAQNAMNLINQYGNGNPRTAFMNYMNSTGKQSLGQQIMQKMGLK